MVKLCYDESEGDEYTSSPRFVISFVRHIPKKFHSNYFRNQMTSLIKKVNTY